MNNGPSQHDALLSRHRNEETFLQGVRDCIPTLLGYLSIGFAAGVVQAAAGLSLLEIALMSLLFYAGSGQFIAASMIVASSSPAAIIITIFFVNLRHFLLSAALSPFFRHLTPLKNMLIGALLTDETFGVAIQTAARRKQISERWMHGLNITAYLNWFAANMAGAVFGQWIQSPEKFGLDFALPAMFIGLLVLAMASRNNLLLDSTVAASAIVSAILLSKIMAPSQAIICAVIITSTLGMVLDKWKRSV